MYPFFTCSVAHFFNKVIFQLHAFDCSLYFYVHTQLKHILKAKIKSSDECFKTSWMNYFLHRFFNFNISGFEIYSTLVARINRIYRGLSVFCFWCKHIPKWDHHQKKNFFVCLLLSSITSMTACEAVTSCIL